MFVTITRKLGFTTGPPCKHCKQTWYSHKDHDHAAVVKANGGGPCSFMDCGHYEEP
jgi:hypothetical protein